MLLFSLHKNYPEKIIISANYNNPGIPMVDYPYPNRFKIYSVDPEASNSIPKDFLEHIAQIKQQYGNKTINASFYQKQLLITIEGDIYWQQEEQILDQCNFAYDAQRIYHKMMLLDKTIQLLSLNRL